MQVQRYTVDERGASLVPGGAGDPHHRPHGSDKFPFCAAARLCNPEIPSRISCKNRYMNIFNIFLTTLTHEAYEAKVADP